MLRLDARQDTQVTRGLYHDLSGIIHFRNWHEALMVKHPGIPQVHAGVISTKQSGLGVVLEALLSRIGSYDTLSAFNQKQAYRSWEFKKYSKKRKALHFLAKKITAKARETNLPGKKIFVAMGDRASRAHKALRGQDAMKVPQIGFARVLNRLDDVEVAFVFEGMTSRICSCCGDGSPHELLKIHKKETFINMETNEDMILWRRGYKILKCKTCKKLWNRDTNAARNILRLALDALNGRDRAEYLTKQKENVSRAHLRS